MLQWPKSALRKGQQLPRMTAAKRAGRRAEILAAAESCFARLGIRHATMRDVIAESGLSAGCVYKHFQSKHEIIAACAADRHASEMNLLSEAETSQDAIGALRLLSRRFIEHFVTPTGRKSRAVSVQTWAEALYDDDVLRHVRKGIDQPLAKITALYARAQKQGRLVASADAEALSRASIALFHGFVLQKLWDPKIAAAPYLIALDTLLAGLVVKKHKRRSDAAR
jgi:TetR/AcrR family transcriptional regulator, repressor for uid operon